MTETHNSKFDLEMRTFEFAKDVRKYLKTLKFSVATNEDAKQVARSSGSVGANYIEANEAFSKKDFVHRIKIARKEAKETAYWLKLLDAPDELIQESIELKKILSAIIEKSK
jgi:four helix bundle protein